MRRSLLACILFVESIVFINNIVMTDIRSLDITLLRAFDALLREGSVSRAAARLHLSQPATSALLARLRELFDDALFIRHARGVTPTPRALQLAEPVRRLLDDLRALLEPVAGFDPATSARVFHLAMNEYASVTLLGPLLTRVVAQAPAVRIACVPLDPDRLRTLLAEGDLDAAVLVRHRAPRELHHVPLLDEDFVLAVPAAHPLARKRRLTAADVVALPHVFVSPVTPSFSGAADAALQALGLRRTVLASVNSFAAAIGAVACGGLAAILPRRLVAAQAPRVALRELPFDMPTLDMVWVTHARSTQDAGLDWLLGEMKQVSLLC